MIQVTKRIEISFYDSITGEFVSSYDAPFKKINLIRCKYSKYIRRYKEVMTNVLRRAGILIGSLKIKIKIYKP